jgi:hypothetical protein
LTSGLVLFGLIRSCGANRILARPIWVTLAGFGMDEEHHDVVTIAVTDTGMLFCKPFSAKEFQVNIVNLKTVPLATWVRGHLLTAKRLVQLISSLTPPAMTPNRIPIVSHGRISRGYRNGCFCV